MISMNLIQNNNIVLANSYLDPMFWETQTKVPTLHTSHEGVCEMIEKIKKEKGKWLSSETGRLILLLNSRKCGVTKGELLLDFYKDYATSSPGRRLALEVCLSKLLQRARQRAQTYGLTVAYCHTRGCWHLKKWI